jgi:hypothetical protein
VLFAPGRARSKGVELKAERRKPSDEQHCDIEDIPSLTGVLAHFRLYEFNAIRGQVQGRPVPCGKDRRFGKKLKISKS